MYGAIHSTAVLLQKTDQRERAHGSQPSRAEYVVHVFSGLCGNESREEAFILHCDRYLLFDCYNSIRKYLSNKKNTIKISMVK